MEQVFGKLAALVAPFHSLAFGGWFGFAIGQKPLAAGILIALGMFAALAGAKHPFDRATAPFVSFLFAALMAPDLQALIDPFAHVSLKLVTMTLPVVLGVLGALVPLSMVFVVTGTAGAAIGAAFVSEKEQLLGIGPGFLIVGAIGAVLGRYLATVITAAVGGVMVTGGVLALAGDTTVGHLLSSSAYIPLGLAIAVTIAGASLQFATYQDEHERRDKQNAKLEKKKLDKENREREARFANYRR